ncbi:MAG TPA: aspartate carbamoyltransferase catalytic subunit, partial [Thermosulfidibacter takaii]|nr:aspartate carbamoyltransferase catalytic subunit [Thermosulfidibacter takaii]
KVPTLRGKTVVNLFFEPSTRTRTSFEIAGKRLSADVINFSAATSSLTKGETLKDTARNIEAMVVDAVVVRHSASGAVRYLARELDVPVINAGDGAHEHPTQGLLDIFTIRERKGSVEGLKVAVAGDIAHSRVARSDIHGLLKLGAQVVVAGPPTMVPPDIERLGVSVASSVEEVLGEVDVVIMLRIQMERQSSPLFPSLREYSRYFGLNMEKLKSVSRDLLIMHPGPVNWGVELSPEVAYHPRNVILDQVTNGVAVRMAVLYAIIGG